jgi:signal transduction histidine kinase
MLYSLRLRLLLMMVAILILAISVITLFASQTTSREFNRYVEVDDEARIDRFVNVLSSYYSEQFNWKDVDSLLHQMASLTGADVALIDPNGNVIATSKRGMAGDEFSDEELVELEGRIWMFTEEDMLMMASEGIIPLGQQRYGVVGAIYVEQPPANPASPVATVNRSLLASVFITGTLAIGLAIALSRRIIGPIESLRLAATEMATGNLSQRVTVYRRDEIGELSRAFNTMADSLAHLEDLRRNMVNDVAHELRTPLSNIRGYLEAIQDEVMEPTPTIINSIHEEVMHLNHLVNDLQELSLAEAGQLRLEIEAVDIKPLLERTVEMLSVNNRTFHLMIDSHLPQVNADSDRVMQILRNLINNALVHSEGAITVAARSVNQMVEISVSDRGEGIAEDKLQHIFERFYRVDPSRNRGTGGAGLGLAIVKQLVEAQGGKVWARSTPGIETVFTFTLPKVV